MQLFLFKLANAFMGNAQMLDGTTDITGKEWYDVVADTIMTFVQPALIIACAAGSIYAIVLGVKMAQADDKEARNEARQKLINILITLVCVVVLILLFSWFSDFVIKNADSWTTGTTTTD